MEIFTSMTFWIIIVVVIVLLAIIGYVAEGTVLAGKKQEKNKNEKKEEKEALSAWTEDAPVADDKQETVYNTADQSWLDMPDVTSTAEPAKELEKPQGEVLPEVAVAPINNNANESQPLTNSLGETMSNNKETNSNPEPKKNGSTLETDISSNSEKSVNQLSDITSPELEPEKPTVKESKANDDSKKTAETLDIWN